MLLLQFCPNCKSEDVLVETHEQGTMVTVKMHCGNPSCLQKEFVWQSQPKIDGITTGAGNLLLSFGILLAGLLLLKYSECFNIWQWHVFPYDNFSGIKRLINLVQY